MKSFACGAVVPGCEAKWVCSSDEDLLVEVAKHAHVVHGLAEIPAELVTEVRRHILTVA